MKKRQNQRINKSLQNKYISRYFKKRNFRKLWIQRINASLNSKNMTSYSKFIHLLKENKIMLNRKIISQLAIFDSDAFTSIIQ